MASTPLPGSNIGPIQNIQVFASGAQTASQSSPTFQNTAYKGAILYLDITAASGTGGLTPELLAVDPVSGASEIISTIGTAKTATGLFVYAIYPATGMATSDGGVLDYPLPANFIIKISAGDSTSYTYSLSMDLLR